jgi:hypothetical protein
VKKAIVAVLVAVLLTAVLLVGCAGGLVTGSGTLKTEEMDFSEFTRVEAGHGFEVEIAQSRSYSVSITADNNLFKHIEVSKEGETLKIGLKPRIIFGSVTLKAKITMPDLYIINLSGGSKANITGFSLSHDFSAELSGGSRVTGNITAGDTNFDLSGGSQVNLEGTADDLVVSGSGGSQLDLEAFSVDNADVHLSGGSRATVNVDGTLDVDLSGGSQVSYVGEPTLGDIDLSGGSRVNRK